VIGHPNVKYKKMGAVNATSFLNFFLMLLIILMATVPVNSNPISTSNAEVTAVQSCHATSFCGLAYYDASYNIKSYRKNKRCSCDEGYRCVLTNNLSDRNAYVFKCRLRSQSENMYMFPGWMMNIFDSLC